MEMTTHKLQKLKKKLHKIEEEKHQLSKASDDLRQTLTEERAAVHDLAHLTEKLTTEMASLENERRKLQVELQTMKAEYVTSHTAGQTRIPYTDSQSTTPLRRLVQRHRRAAGRHRGHTAARTLT